MGFVYYPRSHYVRAYSFATSKASAVDLGWRNPLPSIALDVAWLMPSTVSNLLATIL